MRNFNVSGKANFPSTKRSASPIEFNVSKRGRSSVERRRSLDSISSVSSGSLDRSPMARGFDQRKKHPIEKVDDDVIYVRSHSRSLSPRPHMLVEYHFHKTIATICNRNNKNNIFRSYLEIFSRHHRSRSRDFSARNRTRSPHSRFFLWHFKVHSIFRNIRVVFSIKFLLFVCPSK